MLFLVLVELSLNKAASRAHRNLFEAYTMCPEDL